MSITFTMTGLAHLAKLATLSESMQAVLRVSWHQAGRRMEQYIKTAMVRTQLSEQGHSLPGAFPAPGSGRLMTSISYKVRGWDTLEIGASTEYAGFLESGTTKMAARPYIKPGIENNLQLVEQMISVNMRKALLI